jgi:hypothetical protein
MANHWINTGSSVSGDGYGYAILRSSYSNDATFAVRLRLDTRAAIVPVESYTAAHELGRMF